MTSDRVRSSTGGSVVKNTPRGKVRTFTSRPVWSWCAGCPLHWSGEKSAGALADHVRDTGHTGWAWSPMRFELGPPDEPPSPKP